MISKLIMNESLVTVPIERIEKAIFLIRGERVIQRLEFRCQRSEVRKNRRQEAVGSKAFGTDFRLTSCSC